MGHIPERVNLLPEIPQYACLAIPFVQVLKSGHFGVALGRYIGKKRAYSYIRHHRLHENAVSLEYSHKYTLPFMPSIGNGEYDLAISFLTPHYFVAEKVHAKKKAAWIHTDYSQLSVDRHSELSMWNEYNHIVGVSKDVVRSFVGVFPSLANRTIVIENTLSKTLIDKQAKAFSVENEMPSDSNLNLLSIGRFTYAKNFDNVPDICAHIRASGLPVKWYLIGYGSEESLIRRKIADAGMQKHVIILGKKDNPYPYISACDIYVQPSRYEGHSVTVREAQLLRKPVVITKYPTAMSQLENGVDGVIVPMDNKGCAQEIVDLLQNHFKLEQIIDACTYRDYSMANEAYKIASLFS